MAYSIITSQRARKEIQNASDYYALYSNNAPTKFIDALNNTYETLEMYPFFGVRYNDVRALKLKKFPYSLYFVVNEKHKTVKVLSCFHNKRNPHQRPRF